MSHGRGLGYGLPQLSLYVGSFKALHVGHRNLIRSDLGWGSGALRVWVLYDLAFVVGIQGKRIVRAEDSQGRDQTRS